MAWVFLNPAEVSIQNPNLFQDKTGFASSREMLFFLRPQSEMDKFPFHLLTFHFLSHDSELMPRSFLLLPQSLPSVPAQQSDWSLDVPGLEKSFKSSHIFIFIDCSGLFLGLPATLPCGFLLLSQRYSCAFKCMFSFLFCVFICHIYVFSEYILQLIAKRCLLY